MLKEQRCLVLDPGGLQLITGVGSCESYRRRMARAGRVQGDRLSTNAADSAHWRRWRHGEKLGPGRSWLGSDRSGSLVRALASRWTTLASPETSATRSGSL